MKSVTYRSGHEVKSGDRILYHLEPGEVEFVVSGRSGDPSRDWFLEQFPGGGLMLTAQGFGSVFIDVDQIDEDLEFVARAQSESG